MNRPAVFFDRDNTLIACDGYLGDPDKVVLVEGAAEAVARVRELGFAAVVFSNQSGVARGMYPEEAVHAVNHRLDDLLHEENPRATIDRHDFCPYHPTAKVERYRVDSDLRKPKPGMIYQAASVLNLDLPRSWVIGDAPRDIAAGQTAGLRTVLLKIASLPPSPATNEGAGASPDYVATSLKDAVDFIQRNIDRSGSAQPAASSTAGAAAASPMPVQAQSTRATTSAGSPGGDAWTSSGVASADVNAGTSANATPSSTTSAPATPGRGTPARVEDPVKLTPRPKPSEPIRPAASKPEPTKPEGVKPDSAKPEPSKQGGFVVKPNQPVPVGITWGERMRLAKGGSPLSTAASAARPEVPRSEVTRPEVPRQHAGVSPASQASSSPAPAPQAVPSQPAEPPSRVAPSPEAPSREAQSFEGPSSEASWSTAHTAAPQDAMGHATAEWTAVGSVGGAVAQPSVPVTANSPDDTDDTVDTSDTDEPSADANPPAGTVAEVAADVGSESKVADETPALIAAGTTSARNATAEVTNAEGDSTADTTSADTNSADRTSAGITDVDAGTASPAALEANRAYDDATPTSTADVTADAVISTRGVDPREAPAEPRRGFRREDLMDRPDVSDLPDRPDTRSESRADRAADAPERRRPREIGDPARVEALLEQILTELRRRDDLAAADFSASKLLAGITQVLALAALFYSYLNKDTNWLQATLMVAIALQTLTISLLIMGKQK